jgi:tripartite-type tricarboxylate transporter receptor subunit TctC
MMPAGTPRAIVDKWQQEVARIVAMPDIADKLATLGFIPVANAPDEYGKRIDLEIKKWGKVIQEAKIPQIH